MGDTLDEPRCGPCGATLSPLVRLEKEVKDGVRGSTTSLGVEGTLGAIAVALLWALCYPLVTTAVEFAPPLYTGALRALLAGLVLVALSLPLGRPRPRGAEWLAVVAIGASSTGLGFGGMFLAGGRVSPGLATVVANSQPLLAALIAYFALRERLTGRQAIGMAVAFIGIALIASKALEPADSTGLSLAGILFVLLGAIGVALGNVVMRKFADRLDALTATGYQLLIGSMLLFLGAFATESSDQIRCTPSFLLTLAGLAIPGTAVAFALWFSLLERVPLNVVNVFSFLTPVFALAIAAGFYDERLTRLQILGACLILGGAWISARARGSLTALRAIRLRS